MPRPLLFSRRCAAAPRQATLSVPMRILRRWAWAGMVATLVPISGKARNVEPGAVSVAAQIGPALRLDESLSGARTYALLAGEIDYAFDKNVSALADLGVGLGAATPLRLHAGGRLRMADLGVPLSPYVQAQLGVGWLFDLLGANLTYFGVRLGTGFDYFFTERWSTGLLLGLDLGGTTAQRAAFFGTFDVLAYVRVNL